MESKARPSRSSFTWRSFSIQFLTLTVFLIIYSYVQMPSSFDPINIKDFFTQSFKSHNEAEIFKNQNNGVQTKKIAFMFLIKHDLPLAKLWIKFFKNHEKFYSIYINSKPGFNRTLPKPFSKARFFTGSSKWGGFGIVDSELRLLSSALQDRGNEWFVLVSESCIPLYNFHFFYSYLMLSKLSYVHTEVEDGAIFWDRYSKIFEPEVNTSVWGQGSQWIAMSYDVAITVATDNFYYPKFKQYCPSDMAPNCIPDESYIPSLLRIKAPHLLAYRSLTWKDWRNCSGCSHPKEYSELELGFIAEVRGERCVYNGLPGFPCYLLARKFSVKALPSLLKYSSSLLGY